MKNKNIYTTINLLLGLVMMMSCSENSKDVSGMKIPEEGLPVYATLDTRAIPTGLTCQMYVFSKPVSNAEYTFNEMIDLSGQLPYQMQFNASEVSGKEFRFLFIASPESNSKMSVTTATNWQDLKISTTDQLLDENYYYGILDKTGEQIATEGTIHGNLSRMVGQMVLDIYKIDGSMDNPVSIDTDKYITSVLDRVHEIEIEYAHLTKEISFDGDGNIVEGAKWDTPLKYYIRPTIGDTLQVELDLGYRCIEGVLIDNGNIKKFIQKNIYYIERESKKDIMTSIHYVIGELINSDVDVIGISLPSRIHPDQGIIYDLKLIPHWKGLRIQRIIMERYSIPVYISNDMNCMALGEKYYGQGRSFSNILCVCCGDNIGTSCIINNHLSIYSKESFENIDCLSQSHYNCIRNYENSYLRTMEELHYYQKKIPDKIGNPDDEIWIDIGRAIGCLISIFRNNFDPQIIVLNGYVGYSFLRIQQAIKDYMMIFDKYDRGIYRIIVPGTNHKIKSLGASSLASEMVLNNTHTGFSKKSLLAS